MPPLTLQRLPEPLFYAQSLQYPQVCMADVGGVFDAERCAFHNSTHAELWIPSPKADWDFLDQAMKGLLYKYYRLIPAPDNADLQIGEVQH